VADALLDLAHEDVGGGVADIFVREIERGGSRQMPVAATTCTPDPRDASIMNSMSRPRSGVVRSMIASMPPAFIAFIRSIAKSSVACRSYSHG
jgi:hypothetical protein